MTKKEVKITKFCDRCKKEVESFEISFCVSFPVRSILGDIAAQNDRKVDLCDECTNKLKKFLDNKEIE